MLQNSEALGPVIVDGCGMEVLEGENVDSLKCAIEKARRLGEMGDPAVDSDNDRVPDLEELAQGVDPNKNGPGLLCPSFGCGARVEPEGKVDPASALTALMMLGGLWLLARRRRTA
jgi:MYXO-CTERM domain-containing protein